VIHNADIARVAEQESLPLWLAHGIAADVVLSMELRRQRERFPERERRSNQLAIFQFQLEREERDEP
jgi:hypothetical protein